MYPFRAVRLQSDFRVVFWPRIMVTLMSLIHQVVSRPLFFPSWNDILHPGPSCLGEDTLLQGVAVIKERDASGVALMSLINILGWKSSMSEETLLRWQKDGTPVHQVG